VLASVAAQRGDFELAARLIGHARASPRVWRWMEDMYGKEELEQFAQPLHAHLEAERLEQLLADGAAWPPERAIEEALKI
jgi:hypothetical protein